MGCACAEQHLVKSYFAGPEIVFFFTLVTKNIIFSRNVVCGHTMSGCAPRFIFQIFSTF
jgi:hypothetical protein